MNKKGTGDALVLVAAILFIVLLGVVLVMVLKGFSEKPARELRASASGLEYNLKWQNYLAIPSGNPTAFELENAIIAKDKNKVESVVGTFVQKYSEKKCWKIASDNFESGIENDNCGDEHVVMKINLPSTTQTLGVTLELW